MNGPERRLGMTSHEVLEFAKKHKVQVVDLKFVDLLGTWQHVTIPVEELNEGTFKDGSGFDGSSIRGWKAIHNSDMLAVPDPATACMDPFTAVSTLSLVCNVVDPITRENYDRDPRNIALKAEKYLKSTKIGDISYWGPEAEFFIFDQARYDQNSHSSYYFIDSDEGIWKAGKPLFAGKEYAGVSQLCLHYIGGVLKHAPALAAITNPTTNSYKRLTPGFEAPVLLAYSSRNRSAGIRIPMYSPSPKAKRIEVRFPDPACNTYLAFAAMLMAGLDGIENKIDSGEPMDKELDDREPREAARIPTMPGSLDDAIKHLERDHQFLLKGGVFSEDLVETWITYKRGREVDQLRLRPHPYEFFMYYDV